MTQPDEAHAAFDSVFRRELTRRGAMVGSAKIAFAGTLGAALMARVANGALAQATPAAMDLSMYPELKITNTDQTVTLSTTTIPAGYVLLTVVNQASVSSGSTAGFALVGPPAGMSFADFLTHLKPARSASPAAGATPQSSGGGGLPPIVYQATILGGPGNIDPGQTGQAIINVPAGQWVVPHGQGRGISMITATPGTPGATSEPKAAVTITEIDFGFAGFDHVPAGPQIWKVVHQGTQPHMLDLFALPAGTTLAQLMAVINAPQNATPMPGGLDPNAVMDRGGVDVQSKGTSVYPVLNLPAGRYGAACFIPDPTKGGEPHAMEGMISVFDAGM